MEAKMMTLDCPAYLDREHTVRCGLPAEARCEFVMCSTDEPLESAMIRCPAGHYFCGPIEFLTLDSKDEHDPDTARVGSRAGRDGLAVDGGTDGGGSAVGNFRTKPDRKGRRPNTAPAYYLGYPACLWITVMRSHRGRTAPDSPMRAVTGGAEPHSGAAA
jgi:hypothetical protein